MASFVMYDVIFLVLFTLITFIFLYKRRANLQRQGLLYLYRTKLGIKFMDWTVDRFYGLLKPLQYVVILSGYILMALMIWMVVRIIIIYTNLDFVRALKIPPILPLFPYLPDVFKLDFLPPFYFTYWIIIIAIIAISHEFAHGIFARLNDIKVKATGFGFLGPFLAAFVEPDEKQMNNASKFKQLSILAAGTFANVLMTILFAIILWIFFAASFTAGGINFNTYGTATVSLDSISSVEGNVIFDISEASEFLKNDSLNVIIVNGKEYLVPGQNIETAIKNDIENIVVYENAPAVKASLQGPIVAINGERITSFEELREKINKYESGDEIKVTTVLDGEERDTDLVLGERNGEPYLGIGIIGPSREGIMGRLYGFVENVKDPTIYYVPSWGGDFAWFIYNLLWWIVIINFSVALVNMVPVGIFDGGRFFYLTIWGITGSKKVGEVAFRITTWGMIAVVFWLMFQWVIAFI